MRKLSANEIAEHVHALADTERASLLAEILSTLETASRTKLEDEDDDFETGFKAAIDTIRNNF